MTEDLKESQTEVVCEHDRCIVITHQMKVEFRQHGEIENTDIRDLSTTHGVHAMEVFLNMLGDMTDDVFQEAAWVMEHFKLPPEIVSLACQGNVKLIEVREGDDE